ncbi:glycoside hydrolase family 3 N-terminal domain-containing protein [Bifidobacterium sp. ESL0745]|uniref:beta-glucosidase n=1 Tax=Bifidobacterium sp. ESL0745 TaxID=2983226 RepID=UPI0023F8FA24|nr:glycoside hydrolase family 3 N-terminal domain-containing protein [Bifidobacterium sp. ESL0745]MDF7665808.1 glycoside hydrolase family 3 N-terminal domain-containing protein [Bifidobacterium sp. ESL0745]
MVQINMNDVRTLLKNLTPYLVVIAAMLLISIVLLCAINKHTVKQSRVRKLIHSQSWIVTAIVIVIAVSMMLFGPLNAMLTKATDKHKLQPQTIAASKSLATDIEREAITLLKNDDSHLPLTEKKINVFGWGSTNPITGGTGSGSMSPDYPTTSLLDGLHQAGFKTNSELSKLYTSYRTTRPTVGIFQQDWTLPEVPSAQYSENLLKNATDFSDEAMIVITRVGGEGADLPTNMGAKDLTYHNNSKSYADFTPGETFLQLSRTEQDMINMVTKRFKNVTLVYNGANAMQLNFINSYPQIKSVLWCPPAGQTGFTALGQVLAGTINPSGKTSDTFVKDLTKTPSFNNFGSFSYDNMKEFKGSTLLGTPTYPTFVNYDEGIYVGYRFYETAAQEGLIDYNSSVQYPFGYGLSYTTFTQKMGNLTSSNDTVSFPVTVTNTGNKSGKDTVETYFNPPYTNGGIEKASTNLIAFNKTKTLKPGESQTIHVSFNRQDMASYDSAKTKGYVLEAGDYQVSIRSDSHEPIATQTVNVSDTQIYGKDHKRDSDKTAATNQFDDATGHVTYLSRANHFANYQQATAAPTSMTMPSDLKAKFINASNYRPKAQDDKSDKMPTMGAKNGVQLYQLRGKSYDDPLWDKLLDQMSFSDMDTLISQAGYGTKAIKSVGKIELTDADGPAALNNNFTNVGSIGFPSSTSVACTWNTDLASRYGRLIGDMAHDMNVTGWYAPAMDIHRSAFGGRNFEYFSEDGLLAGTLAAAQIKAAQSKGVYAFMKHFAVNEQETNRSSMLATWANEQSIREIYLKPFELSVKLGNAHAAMTALNYLGPTYVAANPNLLENVLRKEWGFKGFVITDTFAGVGYQVGDQEVRAGNDAMLTIIDTTNHITDHSATSVKAMRRASHNILYTAVTSWKYENGKPAMQTPSWQIATYVVVAILAILLILAEIATIRRFHGRRDKISIIDGTSDTQQ